ncbi:MAG: S8 family serine peptidase [Acidobacteria bacterium]|nr:S8 family serine peptidase [Acidobacteriota bacterium]
MKRRPDTSPCPLCGTRATKSALREAGWLAPEIASRVAREHPDWRREDGACPACVQEILLRTLLERGDAALHATIQQSWPLDSEAAFGVLPTPLRLHADPRYTGSGVTIAFVDSGFYPHPDLVEPLNRIRAWVDAADEPVRERRFDPATAPRWPGWDAASAPQWHGTMTSGSAAGNGRLSRGLYRGLASEADVVLVQARGADGHIGNAAITRALKWLRANAADMNLRVVSISLGGDPIDPLAGNAVDEEVAALVDAGVSVVVAAGNDGARRLVPPATAPRALTIGGLDDKNTFDHREVELWHGNYGEAAGGAAKPELVAPSIWVAAPVLPGTSVAKEAKGLFSRRAAGDAAAEGRIADQKLVTPHYQHVDGTSFAAPLVASVIACMLQANPKLTPKVVRDVLLKAARPVPGAPKERQGAGAVDAGRAVALALREQHGALRGRALSPVVTAQGIDFTLHDHDVREVWILGSWDAWKSPGLRARLLEPGLWHARVDPLPPGRHLYKFLLDGTRWLDDPDNPEKSPDGFGRLNSVLAV